MPKMKARKGMSDRIRVTRNGKLIRAHAMKSHMLQKKSAKRKRAYRSPIGVHSADSREVRRSLGI